MVPYMDSNPITLGPFGRGEREDKDKDGFLRNKLSGSWKCVVMPLANSLRG